MNLKKNSTLTIKWTHYDADDLTRHLFIDANDNFASSLAKMRKKLPKFRNKEYFYYDQHDFKFKVHDDETFQLMMEHFRNLSPNEQLRIRSYQKEDEENEDQQVDENSESSTIESSKSEKFMKTDENEELDMNSIIEEQNHLVALLNINATEGQQNNIRVEDVNSGEASRPSSMRTTIHIDSTKSKRGNIVVCGINNYSKIPRVIRANKKKMK